jgi:hypothetical protein
MITVDVLIPTVVVVSYTPPRWLQLLGVRGYERFAIRQPLPNGGVEWLFVVANRPVPRSVRRAIDQRLYVLELAAQLAASVVCRALSQLQLTASGPATAVRSIDN